MMLPAAVGERGRLFVPTLMQEQHALCPAGCGEYRSTPTGYGLGDKSCSQRCHTLTIRDYLSTIYPTAMQRLLHASEDEVRALFRSLHFYYDHGCAFDGAHCSNKPGVLLRWLYSDLLPCATSDPEKCALAHARFSPWWLSDFDPSAGFLEVEHRATGPKVMHGHDDGQAASSFLDPGFAGMYYTYRRGSGIFLRLGRARRAAGRTAMLADLLLEVAASRPMSTAWPTIASRLHFNSSLSASKDSAALRAVSLGRRSCGALGIRGCRCGNTLPDGWDDALIWAARGLGYDTLLFTASLICRPGSDLQPLSAFAEIVDVRPLRPSWHREQESGVLTEVLDGAQIGASSYVYRKKHDIALEWVSQMRAQQVLTQRDPERLVDDGSALPCNFSVANVTLACAGHVSSDWQMSEWGVCGSSNLMCGHRGVWAPLQIPSSNLNGDVSTLITKGAILRNITQPDTLGSPQSALHGGAGLDGSSSSAESLSAEGTIYRFVFTKVRASGQQGNVDGVQVSEITLYSAGADPRALTVAIALNPGGVRTARLQGAPAAVDGSLVTKWFDGSFASSGTSKLLLQLTADFGPEPVRSYQLFTGNDNPRRDPTEWTLEVREAGNKWRLVDVASGVVPPSERRSAYGRRPVHDGISQLPIHILAAQETKANTQLSS